MKSQIIVLCLLVVAAWGCKIAFRLDVVQDYTDSAAQIALINYFIQSNIPLTLGIVANKFGSDPSVLSVVQNVTYHGPIAIEIASNGWDYELFTNYTIPEQVILLEQSRSQLQTILPGVSVISFIPPYDIADNTTFLAVQQANYRILTANPTDLSCPVLIAGSEPSYALPDSGGVEQPDVQIQLSQCGFSIVRLQPVNYALPGNQVDNTSMSNLGLLFRQLSDFNCTYQLLRDLIPNTITTSPHITTISSVTTPSLTTTTPSLTTTTPSLTTTTPSVVTTTLNVTTSSPTITLISPTTTPSFTTSIPTSHFNITTTNPGITTINPHTTKTSSSERIFLQIIPVLTLTTLILLS